MRPEALRTMSGKVAEMEGLIRMLLTSSRLDGGRLAPKPVAFEMTGAVFDAVAVVTARARLEQAFIGAPAPDEPVPVWADRDHVVRILVNLLNNAISYSQRPARIVVTARRRERSEVSVRDRGMGVSEEWRERIFERFTRRDAGGGTSVRGLGLGLSLSRRLAEVNAGSLVLESSRVGQGSTFVLRLPGELETAVDGT